MIKADDGNSYCVNNVKSEAYDTLILTEEPEGGIPEQTNCDDLKYECLLLPESNISFFRKSFYFRKKLFLN